MRNALKRNEVRAGLGRRLFAATTLVVSMAAFGCTTNQNRASGEPAMNVTPAGPAAPNLTITPGTSSTTPPPMVSAAVDPSVDAIAVLKANEAYRGKVLGTAVEGTNPQGGGASLQQVTGQYISPAALANPQSTVNSSASSAPVPGIQSGAADLGVVAVPSGTGLSAAVTTAPAVSPATTNTVTAPATNTATTGISGTTQPMTSGGAGTNVVVGTGLVSAPAAAANVLATPTTGINSGATATATTPATSTRRSALTVPAGKTSSGDVRLQTINGRVTVTNATAPARSNP